MCGPRTKQLLETKVPFGDAINYFTLRMGKRVLHEAIPLQDIFAGSNHGCPELPIFSLVYEENKFSRKLMRHCYILP